MHYHKLQKLIFPSTYPRRHSLKTKTSLYTGNVSESWVLQCLSEVLLSTHEISFGGSDNVGNLGLKMSFRSTVVDS